MIGVAHVFLAWSVPDIHRDVEILFFVLGLHWIHHDHIIAEMRYICVKKSTLRSNPERVYSKFTYFFQIGVLGALVPRRGFHVLVPGYGIANIAPDVG